MSEYRCIRCKQKLMLNVTNKTLDGKDMCIKCYRNTSYELCKGVFTSEEAYTVFKGQMSQLTSRNNMFRTMLQATILSNSNTSKMLSTIKKHVKELSKELYSKNEADLLPREKTGVVEVLYSKYKELFGDFTVEKCREVSIRGVKGSYYEFLDGFNSDLDVRVIKELSPQDSDKEGCFFTS